MNEKKNNVKLAYLRSFYVWYFQEPSQLAIYFRVQTGDKETNQTNLFLFGKTFLIATYIYMIVNGKGNKSL